MIAPAYLEPVAASLGDLEPSPRVRPVSDTVLMELEYAGHLFVRLQKAVDDELAILRGAGIDFVGHAPMRAGWSLADLAAQVRLQAMLARAGRLA